MFFAFAVAILSGSFGYDISWYFQYGMYIEGKMYKM